MFTTIEEVKALTGKDTTVERIAMAQALVESYVGKVEVEVTNAQDTVLLGRATAYQTAYMEAFGDDIFDQTAVVSNNQYGTSLTFRQDGLTPFIAPLTIIACQKLSWRRMRSVKTGGIFATPVGPSGWTKE